jgi:hypothetical protein
VFSAVSQERQRRQTISATATARHEVLKANVHQLGSWRSQYRNDPKLHDRVIDACNHAHPAFGQG